MTNHEGLDPNYQSIFGHLEDLRNTLLKSFGSILLFFLLSLLFYQDIFHFLEKPLNNTSLNSGIEHFEIKQELIQNSSKNAIRYQIPNKSVFISKTDDVDQIDNKTFKLQPGASLKIETPIQKESLYILGPVDGITTMLKTTFFIALILSSPIWLYFIFTFIAPAVQESHLKLFFIIFTLSFVFISLGSLFAIYITIPIGNQYLTLFNEGIGTNLWTLSNYLDYTLILMIGNGLSFEMMFIGFLLVHYEVLKKESLTQGRRYFIVLAFILGAILTPPDVLTQLMVALPMVLLYECMVVYARLLERKRAIKNYLTGI